MTRDTKKRDYSYSSAEIDALALAACETVVAQPGEVCRYDVEAYQRFDRQAVSTGGYPTYNPPSGIGQPFEGPLPPECAINKQYHLRIGGFRREDSIGPHEAGEMLASAGISYADSLGQGLFEHLVLCRKYGVVPVFEAPAMGFAFPFLESELTTFQKLYRCQIQEFSDWIRRAEAVYGGPILTRPEQPWILWGLYSPLTLYMLSAHRKPEKTAAELQSHSGVFRLEPHPQTPSERANQLKAWAFIRRRHMDVRAVMANLLREVIAPDAVLMDNTHALPVVDYELLGNIYDHPGVAIRSGYLEEESFRSANVAYTVRLFQDLTGKEPIASVRINTTAAGTRFIPGPQTIRDWCDSAVRQGVAGFYFWPVDYPSKEGQYFGAMLGNTDPSTRGQERWSEMLDVFRHLSGARRFRPPAAKIGVLVPYDQLDLSGWRRIFDTFVMLENQRYLSQFISARSLASQRNVLRKFDLVILPACAFLSDSVCQELEDYVHQGGAIVVSCPEGLIYDTCGNRRNRFIDMPIGPRPTGGPVTARFGQGTVFFTDDVEQILRQLDMERHPWVYNVRADTLVSLTGKADPTATPEADPSVEVRHYMYEHSSKAITPFLDKVVDFPDDDLRDGNAT
jgi:hypothetical protein